eukprot:gb/GEZN01002899.1/.p1 GENE.gb/GEZN01002899.1/~~gb/GEZN01002899.1/.p1  ORF type:complete len:518 (+),score=121.26 gb/GEZN01002899.1/:29-1555(+)
MAEDKPLVCTGCKGAIDEEQQFVGSERKFHLNCFKCHKCQLDLQGQPFFYKQDKLWCKPDYQQYFAPKCASCRQNISGKYLTVEGQVYHPEHFVCFVCQGELNDITQIFMHVGNPCCKSCWENHIADPCQRCGKGIVGRCATTTEGKKFHASCFLCSVDDHAFESGEDGSYEYFEHGDGLSGQQIYCRPHFEAFILPACEECGCTIMEAKYLSGESGDYHEECWASRQSRTLKAVPAFRLSVQTKRESRTPGFRTPIKSPKMIQGFNLPFSSSSSPPDPSFDDATPPPAPTTTTTTTTPDTTATTSSMRPLSILTSAPPKRAPPPSPSSRPRGAPVRLPPSRPISPKSTSTPAAVATPEVPELPEILGAPPTTATATTTTTTATTTTTTTTTAAATTVTATTTMTSTTSTSITTSITTSTSTTATSSTLLLLLLILLLILLLLPLRERISYGTYHPLLQVMLQVISWPSTPTTPRIPPVSSTCFPSGKRTRFGCKSKQSGKSPGIPTK